MLYTRAENKTHNCFMCNKYKHTVFIARICNNLMIANAEPTWPLSPEGFGVRQGWRWRMTAGDQIKGPSMSKKVSYAAFDFLFATALGGCGTVESALTEGVKFYAPSDD